MVYSIINPTSEFIPIFKQTTFMKRVFLLLLLAPLFGNAQIGDFIHVDQFGYLPTAEKVAVISNPQVGYNSSMSFNPTNNLVVKNAINNQTVFTAAIQIWDSGNTHTNSGDIGWWFDFSALQSPGDYYIADTVNNQRSFTFSIDSNAYYKAFKDAGRMFFYNRCNYSKSAPYADTKWTDANNFLNTLQDGDCHRIHDSLNQYPVRDLTGGWFDAGDYNKYVTFAYSAIHNLLTAYEENPEAFGDDWNIPESGNGIPDIIDEIKWETDWLLKMVDSSGETSIKMGSSNYSDNSSYPPSNNTDPRYYGPNCTSASISAASSLAHAGIVMSNFPSLLPYVDSLKFKAKAAADYARPLYFSNGLQTDCDDGSIISGDADVDSAEQLNRLITASIYLWELANDTPSKSFVDFNYFILDPYVNYGWSPYNNSLTDALIRYAKHPNANPSASNGILNNIGLTVTNNWSDYYGWNNSDLYRAPVPNWTYHWGSNSIVATYGNMNNLLADYKIGLDSLAQRKRAAEHLHYFHGVNPNGLVYLSNMYNAGAEKSCNEVYHTWFADGSIYDNAQTSANGPAPGYVVGGPNEYFSNNTLSPPYGQPRQKSYLDFNTSWPQNSWEVSEPAIYYQAAYLRLLSRFVKPNVVAPNSVRTTAFEELNIYPNPARNILFIENNNQNFEIDIIDINGQIIQKTSLSKKESRIDINDLPNGFYILRFSSKSATYYKKLIKK